MDVLFISALVSLSVENIFAVIFILIYFQSMRVDGVQTAARTASTAISKICVIVLIDCGCIEVRLQLTQIELWFPDKSEFAANVVYLFIHLFEIFSPVFAESNLFFIAHSYHTQKKI